MLIHEKCNNHSTKVSNKLFYKLLFCCEKLQNFSLTHGFGVFFQDRIKGLHLNSQIQ